jgi:fructokinase
MIAGPDHHGKAAIRCSSLAPQADAYDHTSMNHTRMIVGLGEALYDLFPDGQKLGGAPLNMAVHAQQLGNAGILISRIGDDALGDQLREELTGHAMTLAHLQVDPDLPTGTVVVDLDDAGQPTYDIVELVAWDNLQFDPDMEDVAAQCEAVCFGTLAQRVGQTRNTMYRFLSAARRAIRLLDVNLRQEFYDRRILTRSMELATAVKLNHEELAVLRQMFNLPEGNTEAARQLIEHFELKWLAVTHGAEGTQVVTATADHQAPSTAAAPGGDAVGAGDSVAAALLHGAVRRWDWPRTLQLANRLGAYVASQNGACPELPDDIKQLAAE